MNSPGEFDFVVYVVDDDPDVRDALGLLLRVHGYRTALFETAEAFLRDMPPEAAGCLITDIRMPGMSGLELQRELGVRESALPVVVLTAHGEVDSARQALRARAVDFLLKPFQQADLLAAIEQGFAMERNRLAAQRAAAADNALLATLTAREREVAALLATGAQNLSIARQLDISPRTVEIHKARCMEKLGARSIADLVRIADRTTLGRAKDSAAN
jgi:FixJ family two-component response regulator